jgi:hypothetical protein
LDQPESYVIGKALNRTSIALGFRFFNFSGEYLKRLQSSEPLHTKTLLLLLLIQHTGFMYTNRNLFRQNRSPKMRESQQLFFGLRLVRRIIEETLITSRNPNQNSATLWRIFSSNKKCASQWEERIRTRTRLRLNSFLL